MSPEKYRLEIDLNVLNHLGLNLYSNVPAVLSELVANAWDADAKRVSISIKGQDDKEITIQDNGCGMNDKDLREKFLTVGYQRRDKKNGGDLTPGEPDGYGEEGYRQVIRLFYCREDSGHYEEKRLRSSGDRVGCQKNTESN